MAKNPRLTVPLAKELTEVRPVPPSYIPLLMEDRDRLTAILNDPVFIKAWTNAELAKPSVFPASSDKFEGEHGPQHAASQLHRIQGWELHRAALIRQAQEVKQRPKAPAESYPATGSLEAEVAARLPKQSPKPTKSK